MVTIHIHLCKVGGAWQGFWLCLHQQVLPAVITHICIQYESVCKQENLLTIKKDEVRDCLDKLVTSRHKIRLDASKVVQGAEQGHHFLSFQRCKKEVQYCQPRLSFSDDYGASIYGSHVYTKKGQEGKSFPMPQKYIWQPVICGDPQWLILQLITSDIFNSNLN